MPRCRVRVSTWRRSVVGGAGGVEACRSGEVPYGGGRFNGQEGSEDSDSSVNRKSYPTTLRRHPSRMDQSESELKRFMSGLTLAECVGFVIIILTIVWLQYYRGGFAWSSDYKVMFNWHPLLMILSMIFLYANVMLVYRTFRHERKKKLKLVHAGLFLVIFVMAVIGLSAVFNVHNTAGTPNMYSLHSWLGICTMVLFACQWLCGLLSFLFPGVRHALRAWYLPVHTFFGMVVFILASCTVLMGLLEKAIFTLNDKTDTPYQFLPREAVVVNVMGILVALFAGLVIFLVGNPVFKRLSLPEDEMLLNEPIN
ncbi:unnamed protein product [Darwinula stevensoni]|uniref:Cytochrome b561 domain-containing protein n=1 Tax=Darwinula stevensoni TaxID=69355 RepID=A0A7R9AHA4_9CRUS|nr:unnamed protein product [Darwinula stevensoni]CAG0905490.1 unnamed protein product [Darwinula stevensoni]